MSEPLDPLTFGESQPCFGCSPTHHTGFRLQFCKEDDAISTFFDPGESHQGPPGVMHGGLVTTLADELAAWAIIGLLGKFGFTGSLNAKFLNPVRVGRRVTGRSRIVRDGSRVVVVGVVLRQADDAGEEQDVYKGEFTFVLLDRAGAERLLQRPLPPEWAKFAR
jgi:uncharacterized protein (TIGR00369 family)